jgi:endonuclease-3
MKTDWPGAFQKLIRKYKKRPHPLEYHNLYELLVMVVLSAQSSDKQINAIAPELFRSFPDMRSLASATEKSLFPLISKVINFRNKGNWLMAIAREIKEDSHIPLNMKGLTALPGIGRKSANVILRGAGKKAEGIIVDLHVIRVAGRLGITGNTDPKKIEEDLMEMLPEKQWSEAGMALSFLGRDICRPSHPEHEECIMRDDCKYYKKNKRKEKK